MTPDRDGFMGGSRCSGPKCALRRRTGWRETGHGMFEALRPNVNESNLPVLTIRDVVGRAAAAARIRALRAARFAAGVLLPPVCSLCGLAGFESPIDLCPTCRRLLPLSTGSRPITLPGINYIHAPFRYAWPVDRFIRELKFGGERRLARLLGTLLAEHWDTAAPRPEVLIPVPLHPARYRERG